MTDQHDQLPAELTAAIGAFQRAVDSGQRTDFDTAVAAWDTVLAHPFIVGAPHLERIARNQIGEVLQLRYELSGSEEDLNRAVTFASQAVRNEPQGSDMLPRFRAAFSRAFRARYILHGDDADLTTATDAMAQALSATRERGERAQWSAELSALRRLRHEADGDPAALDDAVQFAEHAVAFGTPGDGQQAERLTVLGNALLISSVHRPEDLERALAVYQDALELGTVTLGGRPTLLINIGTLLLRRFRRGADPADLERAIARLRDAEADPGLTEVLRPALMANMAEALRAMSELTGDRSDLEEFVVGSFASTIERTAGGSPHRRTATGELAWALLEHYESHSTVDDLDRGISLLRQSAAGLSPHAKGKVFPALGALLRARYERHGRLDDLTEAIETLRSAAAGEAPGSRRAQILLNLVSAVRRRYEQTHELTDLHAMLEAAGEALEGSSQDDPDHPMFLLSAGQVLNALYDLTGDLDDLEQALVHWREALRLLPPTAAKGPAALNSLALGLIERFRLSGDAADLNEAIPALRQVVALTPRGSPDLPSLLNNLANGLRTRYRTRGDHKDLTEAVTTVRTALELPQLSSPAALQIARSWGRDATDRGAWPEAAELYGPGLQASRQLFATQVVREHKETWLRDASGLPAEAAYACARTGALRDAVTILEQGQAQLLSESMDRDEADLEQTVALGQAELGARFRAAAREVTELERAVLSDAFAPPDALPHAAQLRRARTALAEVSAQIRALPGLDGFLRQSSFEDVLAEAGPCPLVYLSSSAAGGLALIVQRDGRLTDVWLEGLGVGELQQRFADYFPAD
ncbi:hypothetical protein, partial [Streptomyces sp. H39-S7]|uniref:hypothetical protein n=1 Tax=Streptomyces sp. H39-S7 TaxID=3004357 RepID=UPI0022AFCB11